MRIFKKVLSVLMVLALLVSINISALAASYDAASYEDLEIAFGDTSGEDVDINVTASINFDNNTLYAKDGILYTFDTQNGSVLEGSAFGGEGSVVINMDLTGFDADGISTDNSVKVTVNGDINAFYDDGVSAGDQSEVKVNGDIYSVDYGVYAQGDAKVSVDGNVSTEVWTAVLVSDNADVDVSGDVSCVEGYAVSACDESNVTIGGDASSTYYVAVDAYGESNVTIGGDVSSTEDFAVSALDESNVTIGGDVFGGSGDPDDVDFSDPYAYSDGNPGIYASGEASITVHGSVYGGDGFGPSGSAGQAVVADGKSVVTVYGDAVGGNVTADPANEGGGYESVAGTGVLMVNTATVKVGGNAIGGSTNVDSGEAGSGVCIAYLYTEGEPGELSVKGETAGGKAPANGQQGNGIYFDNYFGESFSTENIPLPSVTVGKYSDISFQGFSDEDGQMLIDSVRITGIAQADFFWQNVVKQIQAAEKGEKITVDAGARTTMPAFVMDAVRDSGVILVIQWDGGDDIVIEKAYDGDAEYTVFQLSELAELLK